MTSRYVLCMPIMQVDRTAMSTCLHDEYIDRSILPARLQLDPAVISRADTTTNYTRRVVIWRLP